MDTNPDKSLHGVRRVFNTTSNPSFTSGSDVNVLPSTVGRSKDVRGYGGSAAMLYDLLPPQAQAPHISPIGLTKRTKRIRSKASSNKTNSAVFKINFANIRGLNSNKHDVSQVLESTLPDMLFLTETQVSKKPKKSDLSEYENQGYRLESAFAKHHGLCAYVANHVAYKRLEKSEINNCDYNTLFLKVCLPESTLLVVGLYRSPNPKLAESSNFFEDLSCKIDSLTSSNPHMELVVLGDFNVHNQAWLQFSRTDLSPSERELGVKAQLLESAHDMTQIVKFPTHVNAPSQQMGNMLDLYLTSLPEVSKIDKLAPIGNSDHVHLTCSIDIAKNIPPTAKPRRVYHYRKADWEGMRRFFSSIPWKKSCIYNDNVNDAVSVFTQIVNQGVNSFIPNSMAIPKEQPWFTEKSAAAVALKSSAFNEFILNSTDKAWKEYAEVRRECKKVINAEKKAFFKGKADKFAENPTGSREFWQLANAIRSNFTKPSLPPLMNQDNVTISDPKMKANLLASHFTKNSTLDSSSHEPIPLDQSGKVMPAIKFRRNVVRRLLLESKINKASGSDSISPLILKKYADIFAPVLTSIFALSYKHGTFPDSWKVANVQPVPKKGDKSNPANYRPIAILSVVAKVFERYLNYHIVSFLEDSKLIDDKQYGFRGGRSTSDLLIYVTHKWNSALEHLGETYAVALDIAKAFDRVWHQNLLMKLTSIGVHPKVVTLIGSFLNERKFCVLADGETSDLFEINAGVPQGSVLSPTLFLVYINDLLKLTINPIHSYADDSTLHASHSAPKRGKSTPNINEVRTSMISSINTDLNTIFAWGERNLVEFNANKTQLCIFSRLKTPPPEQKVEANGTEIEKADSIRLLGVDISSNLLWNDHIMAMAKSASQKLGFLYRSRKFFDANQLLLIYKSFIRPCIEYASPVWGGAAETTLGLLDSIQRRAVRLIGDESVTNSLDSLRHRRKVADLTVFYKYRFGLSPSELEEAMPASYKYPRATRQAAKSHPYVVELETCRTTKYARGDFFNRVAAEWNNLPPAVFPESFSVQSFKKNVNAYLLRTKNSP